MKQLSWKAEIHSGKVVVDKTEVFNQIKLVINDDELFGMLEKRIQNSIGIFDVGIHIGAILESLYRAKRLMINNSLEEYYVQDITFDYNQYFAMPEVRKTKPKKKLK